MALVIDLMEQAVLICAGEEAMSRDDKALFRLGATLDHRIYRDFDM